VRGATGATGVMRRALALLALGLAGCGGGSPSDAETFLAPERAHAGPTLRVAAVQFDARPGEPEHNRGRMLELVRAAAERDAELVLFHENALLDYGPRVRALAEPVPDGPTCRALDALARELGVWIGAGLAERAGEQVHVTHAFFGPDGYVGRYRKTWLFRSPSDPYRDEWAWFDPGDGPALLEIAGLSTAVLICADADSARQVERIAALAPELVLFPNNRSRLPGPERFADLARRVGAPVVLANRVGRSWQHACKGGSLVLAADGRLLARANRAGREEILVYDVPLDGGPP
jgi:N-carbamoylputrescine amidase